MSLEVERRRSNRYEMYLAAENVHHAADKPQLGSALAVLCLGQPLAGDPAFTASSACVMP